MSLPLASYGHPVPYIIGRQRVMSPNIIWYGGLSPIRESVRSTSSTTQTDENGNQVITEKTTITYNTIGYRVSMQLGLCLGPEVQLLGIYADNVLAWEGASGAGRTEFTIDGGFARGAAIFSDGAFDQAPDPYLLEFIPEDLPGYVGIAHIILTNVRTQEMGSQLGFEVRRVPNPLELDLGVNLSGDDINCASAMVDIITNSWGGAGVDIGRVDLDAAVDAANLFASEGNYCSLISKSVTKAPSLLSILQDQTNSIIYADPGTNKIVIRPIRKSFYAPGDAPRFSFNNLTVNNGFRSFNKSGWPSTVEDSSATYTSRENNYETVPVAQKSLPSFIGEGRSKRSVSLDYPTVFDPELARNLLMRDFAKLLEPIFSATFETNLEHKDLVPGDIGVISIPRYGLFSVPVYVTKVRQQPIETGTVVLEVNQLIMRDAVPAIASPPAQYDPDLEPKPEPPLVDDGDFITFREAPFWIVKNKGTVDLYSSAKNKIVDQFALLTPVPAGGVQSYFFAWTDIDDGRGYRMVIPEQYKSPSVLLLLNAVLFGKPWDLGGHYPGVSSLVTQINWDDALDTGVIPSVTINGAAFTQRFNLSDMDGGIEQVKQGRFFILIHDEIFICEEIVTVSPGAVYELINVHRALLDTVPQDHGVNSTVYFINSHYSYLPDTFPMNWQTHPDTEWKIGSGVITKLGATPTPDGQLVSYPWKPTRNRGGSPLRPHDTHIDGVRSADEQFVYLGYDHEITWRTRNRDKLTVSSQTDDAEPGELVDGFHQVHRVFIVDSADVMHDCGATSSASDANDLTITIPPMALGSGQLFVQSEMLIGGETFVSQFRDMLPVYVLAAPPRITEDSDVRVTEDGDMRIIE